ncbi:hypothetical protein B0O99DRAFT_638427 [Bisporella sp. PMI_857]|nr:hypothetical protein B0O99DRAFT_638427 [Bisporella sp. PMI_857]
MTQINTWGLTGNPDSFRQGATALRNARNWAQEQRNSFIAAANERARLLGLDNLRFAQVGYSRGTQHRDLCPVLVCSL